MLPIFSNPLSHAATSSASAPPRPANFAAPLRKTVPSNAAFNASSVCAAAGAAAIKPHTANATTPFGIGTPVQPDVVFFRKANEPDWEEQSFDGVPDLVAEVLSPRTRSRDRKVKLQAYQDAGVPEYWMADPSSRTVEVHVLRDGRYIEHCRGGIGERVRSAVLPGFELEVAGLFPRRE